MFFFKAAVLTSSKQDFEMQIVSCVNFGKVDIAINFVKSLLDNNDFVHAMECVGLDMKLIFLHFRYIEENKLILI